MDTLAAERLGGLRLVQQGRLSQLSRALAAAKAQYSADSPEVQSAQAAVAATTATVGRVFMAHQQSTTPDPEVAQEGWALHGRVFDADSNPVTGFTVFLVDAEKTYQQSFGFSYTDDTGYFLINYPGAAQSAQTKASGKDSQAPATAQLFLEIANTKAQPVFLSVTAFQPAAGSASYQNVVLPAGNRPIGDPPNDIRGSAVPKEAKKRAAPRSRK
jgi:hypothetical protein